MATNFPVSLDVLQNPTGTTPTNSSLILHSAQHTNANDAIEALQLKVGITDSADTTSIDYKLRQKLQFVSAPVTAAATGTVGQVAYDATYFYVCIATNTWVRTALVTW